MAELDRQVLEKRQQDAAAKEQAPRGGLLGWSAAPAARSTSRRLRRRQWRAARRPASRSPSA
jgi:hypothetical protein